MYFYQIGSKSFDRAMKMWLDNTLRKIRGPKVSLSSGIEVCAGMGRNMKILTKHCKEVHGIEQIDELAAKFHNKVFNRVRVQAFVTQLQKFKWNPNSYDLVTGIWCLCYLSHDDIDIFLRGAAYALR